jgi:hypothetical protein
VESDRVNLVLSELGGPSFWSLPPAEQAKKWAALQPRLPSDRRGRVLLRMQALEKLLARATADPANTLAAADALAELLTQDDRPTRPTEAHFLAMLNRHLPADPARRADAPRVQRALDLRVRAEKVALGVSGSRYAYCEQIAPWITAAVRAADEERRLGEDLLFSTDAADWRQADTHFAAADLACTRAAEVAGKVQTAIAVRDEALATLPDYAHWLALRRRPGDLNGQMEANRALGRLEQLLAQAHALAADLARTPAAEGADDIRKRADALEKQAVGLREGMAGPRADYEAFVKKLDSFDAAEVWPDLEAARAVPVPTVELRRTLWAAERLALTRLVDRERGPSAAAVGDPVSVELTEERAIDHAQRQGRLALAVIGRDWFDLCPVPGPREPFDRVHYRLDHFPGSADGWQSVRLAGDQVGLRFAGLVAEINAALRLRREQTDPGKDDDLAREAAALERADGLGRLLDGTSNGLLADSPAEWARRLRTQNLLLAQARRALADHWYGGPGDPRPEKAYYRVAGLGYVEDARRLMQRGSAAKVAGPVRDVRAALEADDPFPVQRSPADLPKFLGDESCPLEFRVPAAATPAGRPGFPVFWLDAAPPMRADGLAPGTRQPRRLNPGQGAAPLDYTLTGVLTADNLPPATGAGGPRAMATLRGLFRGRVLDLPTPVPLFPVPDVVVVQPPTPTTARVALRTDPDLQRDFGTVSGAVVVVLDCSGSMGERRREDYSPTTKYNQATAALGEVLGRLPPGTLVGLRLFGQAVPPGNTVESPEGNIETIRPLSPWKAGDAEELLGQVRYPTRIPWNESPIARAMLEAKAELASANVSYKTLLVLTDGKDNRYEKDPEYAREGKPLPQKLREAYDGSGIVVNVISFRAPKAEKPVAREQFGVVETFTPPGRFVPVEDAKTLAIEVEKAIRQRQRVQYDLAEAAGGKVVVAGSGDGARAASAGPTNDLWSQPLPPGQYLLRVRLGGPEQTVEQPISLRAGDALLVKMVRGPGGNYRLERVACTQEDYRLRPPRPRAGGEWDAAALQVQWLEPGRLQALVLLEEQRDRVGAVIHQVRPAEVWFELTAAGGSGPVVPPTVRWGERFGYPAPGWLLDGPAWPLRPAGHEPLPPRLRVWWSPPAAEQPQRLPDLSPEVRPGPTTADGVPVTVESVRVEQRPVVPSAGEAPVMKSCLAVRVSFPEANPVWLRPLPGAAALPAEHRYYYEAHKYVALFWSDEPWTDGRVRQALAGLRWQSVGRFQREAEAGRRSLDLAGLGEPRADDARPPEPAPLR